MNCLFNKFFIHNPSVHKPIFIFFKSFVPKMIYFLRYLIASTYICSSQVQLILPLTKQIWKLAYFSYSEGKKKGWLIPKLTYYYPSNTLK